MAKLSEEQWEEWARKIGRLQDEIEAAVGEPSPGIYDHPVPTLLRFAWYEARDELEAAKGRDF